MLHHMPDTVFVDHRPDSYHAVWHSKPWLVLARKADGEDTVLLLGRDQAAAEAALKALAQTTSELATALERATVRYAPTDANASVLNPYLVEIDGKFVSKHHAVEAARSWIDRQVAVGIAWRGWLAARPEPAYEGTRAAGL